MPDGGMASQGSYASPPAMMMMEVGGLPPPPRVVMDGPPPLVSMEEENVDVPPLVDDDDQASVMVQGHEGPSTPPPRYPQMVLPPPFEPLFHPAYTMRRPPTGSGTSSSNVTPSRKRPLPMDTNDCSSEGRREEEGSKAELPPLTPVYYPGRPIYYPGYDPFVYHYQARQAGVAPAPHEAPSQLNRNSSISSTNTQGGMSSLSTLTLDDVAASCWGVGQTRPMMWNLPKGPVGMGMHM